MVFVCCVCVCVVFVLVFGCVGVGVCVCVLCSCLCLCLCGVVVFMFVFLLCCVALCCVVLRVCRWLFFFLPLIILSIVLFAGTRTILQAVITPMGLAGAFMLAQGLGIAPIDPGMKAVTLATGVGEEHVTMLFTFLGHVKTHIHTHTHIHIYTHTQHTHTTITQ